MEQQLQQQEQYGTFGAGMEQQQEMQQQQQYGGGGGGGGGSEFSLTEGHGGREERYREWLVATFKVEFDQYEAQGGMPITVFHSLVQSNDPGRRRKLTSLFTKLDTDGNNRVSWSEFFDGLTYTKKSEVKRRRKVVNKVVKQLVPAAKRKTRETKKEAADEGEPIPEESYLEAYTCRPPPLFIPILFIIIWIFFIIYAIELSNGPEWNHVTWEFGLPYYSPLAYCPSVRQQVWRYLSYLLLHNGYHHIVFNTVLGCLLGIPLEAVHKAWRVAPVFLIGVIAGSLASSIVDPGTALVGASGGVYALIGAHYALVLMNWEEVQKDWLKCRSNPLHFLLRFLLSGVMRLVFLTLFVAFDFGVAAYKRYALPIQVPMSVAAHIGGMLAGLLIGTPVLRNIDKKPWEGVVAIVSLAVGGVLMLFAILWNIFYRGFPNVESVACSNPALVT